MLIADRIKNFFFYFPIQCTVQGCLVEMICVKKKGFIYSPLMVWLNSVSLQYSEFIARSDNRKLLISAIKHIPEDWTSRWMSGEPLETSKGRNIELSDEDFQVYLLRGNH